MEKKRFWKKAITIFVATIFIIAAVTGVAVLIYNNHLNHDDSTLLERYETQKEKCELLKSIPNDFIEEGKGINLQDIPDNIKYEIKNQNDGNIQFYYYIEQETDFNSYKAWITLSRDYEVIEEKYGDIELEDFEIYKSRQKKLDMFLAALFAMLFICLIVIALYIVIGIGRIIYILVKVLKNKKSQS